MPTYIRSRCELDGRTVDFQRSCISLQHTLLSSEDALRNATIYRVDDVTNNLLASALLLAYGIMNGLLLCKRSLFAELAAK
jgi:hypothetical protein